MADFSTIGWTEGQVHGFARNVVSWDKDLYMYSPLLISPTYLQYKSSLNAGNAMPVGCLN